MTETIKSNPDQSRGWAPYASVALATLGGAAIGGIPGGIVGGTTSAMDEYLISTKESESHEISVAMFHHTITFQPWVKILSAMFPAHEPVIQGISYTLSTLAPRYTNDFLDFNNKIDVPLDSFLTINKLFDEKEIFSSKEVSRIYNKFLENPVDGLVAIKEDAVEVYKNPFLSNFIASNALSLSNVGLNNLFLYSLGSYSSGRFISNLLTSHNKAFADPKFLTDACKIIGILLAQLFSQAQISAIENNLSQEHLKIIVGKGSNILLDKGNSRKILGADKEEGQLIIQELIDDLFTLLEGANKLNGVITKSTEVAIAINNLVNFAPDILLPYTAISLILKQKFLNDLIPKSKVIAEELSITSMKVTSLSDDIINKAEQISLRDGEEFIKHKFNIQWRKLKELFLNATAINKSRISIDNAESIHDRAIDVAYFGSKYYANSLDISKIPIIYSAMGNVYNFLSSNLNSQTDNIEISLSKKRIDKLFELINTPNHHAERLNNEDGNIIFKNYLIFLGERKLVQIDDLTFENGKHYAITGAKGSGKSSTVTDLKAGVVGLFNSYGEIHLPLNKKIIFLDQKLYLPKESTLLETLYFPNNLDELTSDELSDFRDSAINLLKEFDMEEFISQLDSKNFRNSGGEGKTFGFIQAILAKPDILIMDETFNELDHNSIIQVQQAMVKYLEGTSILVINHYAHDQNYNNFYDAEMHFENGTVTINDIALTPMPIGNKETTIVNEEEAGEVMDFMQSIVEREDLDTVKLKQLYEKLSNLFHTETHENFILEQLPGECSALGEC